MNDSMTVQLSVGEVSAVQWSSAHVETSHHVVQIGDEVAARLGMMAAPLNDTTTGLATIEGIDLDADVPCYLDNDEHPADLVFRTTCPWCRHSTLTAACREGWAWMGEHAFVCTPCGRGGITRDGCMRIVEVLR